MLNPNYSHDNASYRAIQDRKKAGDILTAAFISRALVQEAKTFKNFQNAEELYTEMETVLMQKRLFDENYVYNSAEVGSYQRAISTLVRYAPTPEKALEYASIFFKDKDEPFRTASKELVVLTNLIYVYKSKNSEEYMRMALELTKLALAIGVYKIDAKHYEDPYSRHNGFNNTASVFEAVTQRVLYYFKMELNTDKTDLVPRGSQS